MWPHSLQDFVYNVEFTVKILPWPVIKNCPCIHQVRSKKELALEYDTIYSRIWDKQGDKDGHAS